MHRLCIRALLVLGLAAGCEPPPTVESLLNGNWMAQATLAEVQALLAHGAKVNVRTKHGATPLHGAARKADPAVLALLLAHGAKVNVQDEDGYTPLHRAASNADPAVLALLLDHGTDAKLRDKDGKLPVDLAEQNRLLNGTDAYRRLHDASF